MPAKNKAVLLDICRVVRIGNSLAVVLDSAWLKENALDVGDKVLIRAEGLKGAKDLKQVK